MKDKINYQILDQTFSSQKKAEDSARKILNDGFLNTALKEADFEYMFAYFKLFHHEWEDKVGVGIKNIYRIKEPVYGKVRGFEIERIDGSRTDISFKIGNISKDDFNLQFSKALRFIIEPQIIEFKRKSFGINVILFCPIENTEVTKENCHIDHYSPTFKEILDGFVSKYDIKIDQTLFVKSGDNQKIPELSNNEIKKQFFDYHKETSNLRVLSIKGNLSRIKTKK